MNERGGRDGRLTYEERKKLRRLYERGEKAANIAKTLGCSRQLIYRELKRGNTGNTLPDGHAEYSADLAQLMTGKPRESAAAALVALNGG